MLIKSGRRRALGKPKVRIHFCKICEHYLDKIIKLYANRCIKKYNNKIQIKY